MGHSKIFMLERIKDMGDEIMNLCRKEEITIRTDYFEFPDETKDLRADFIRPAWKWLAGVYEADFGAVRKVRKLVFVLFHAQPNDVVAFRLPIRHPPIEFVGSQEIVLNLER